MNSGQWSVVSFGVVAAFALGIVSASALPEDIVPRGDVAYDLLSSLSSAGQVKGVSVADFFRGDRLYTRREMAEFVADLLATNDVFSLPSSTRSQIRALVVAFAPELRSRGVVLPNIPAGDAGFSFLLKARAGATPVSGDLIGRLSVASAIGRDGYVAGSVGNYRDEWNALRPLRDDFPPVETLFVRYNTPAIDITIGRQPLRWGPGFSGAMVLGDDAPSIPQIRFEKGFFLPGSLGRRTGRLYFTQFAGQVFEDEIPGVDSVATGTRRFIFGRRIETAGDRGAWKLSLAESFKSTRLPGAGWAFVLPFYAYQNAFTDEPNNDEQRPFGFITGGKTYPNTLWFNYLIDAQVSYRAIPDRDLTVYTDFLVDDIQAPKGLQGGMISTPRKVGFLLGGYCPRLDNAGKYGLRLEFSTIDPDTFGSVSAPVAYAIEGAPLGYPGGGNTRLFFGRFDTRVSEKAKAAAEIAVRRKDDKNRPGLSGNRFSLYGSYNLNRAAFLGARLDHVTGDIRLPNVSTQEETRGEVSIGYGF
ncbi:MAG: hypothetical protein H8F28_00345 [Fibrella sp.]|nr:hypothetical protein [Armatimonadota bacterium]